MLSDLIEYIRRVEGLKVAEKLMLYQLCAHAGPDGQDIHPGLDLLARQCNISERYARKLIDKLMEYKYLEGSGMKVHVKVYRIPVEKLIPDYAERLEKRRLKKTKLVAAPQEQNLRVVPPETQPLAAAPSRPLPGAYEDWKKRRPGETAMEYARRVDRGA